MIFLCSMVSVNVCGSHHDRDYMVVGFTTTGTYAISVYHHWSCEFESCSGKAYLIQHDVIKFVSDLRQVCGFRWVLWFPPSIKLTAGYNWNIVESGIKHHKPNPTFLINVPFNSHSQSCFSRCLPPCHFLWLNSVLYSIFM